MSSFLFSFGVVNGCFAILCGGLLLLTKSVIACAPQRIDRYGVAYRPLRIRLTEAKLLCQFLFLPA